MKIVLGIVAGVVIAFACIMGVEMLDHMLYPPPPGMDFNDPAQLARLMHMMPTAAIAIVALGWFIAAWIGGWAANAIAKRAVAGWVVALLIVAGAVVNLMAIPHPAWMWAAGLLLPLAGGWLAQRFARIPLRGKEEG